MKINVTSKLLTISLGGFHSREGCSVAPVVGEVKGVGDNAQLKWIADFFQEVSNVVR